MIHSTLAIGTIGKFPRSPICLATLGRICIPQEVGGAFDDERLRDDRDIMAIIEAFMDNHA